MKFEAPLEEGVFLKRYKRFFADIDLNGKTVVAHVANSGSMKGCNLPQSPCRVSFKDDPNRKLKYSLEMIQAHETWVGVNTSVPNRLAWEAWEQKIFSHWQGYDCAQREVKISKDSRIDLVLFQSTSNLPCTHRLQMGDFEKKEAKLHIVEIKNVSLTENGVALFPDAVTERGQKHIQELVRLMELGHKCELLFTIQRNDATKFSPADHIDPEYGRLLRAAQKKGLLISPYVCSLSANEIRLTNKKLPVAFDH